MKYLSVLLLAIALILSSCGEKVKQMKEAADLIQKAPEMAKNMEQGQKVAEQKRAERAKRGDTLAMPFQKLETYLPALINGYTAEEPEGSSMNTTGVSYSQASRKYTAKQADGTESQVTVEIVDYNAAYQMFAGFTFWLSGFSQEDKNGYSRTFDVGMKDCAGFEHFDKNSKTAELTITPGYRFIIKVTATNQKDTEFGKSIAKSIKLSELSTM